MADKKKDSEPPSLFDNMALFAASPATPPPTLPSAESLGLTGTGPMKELFDFNFRQYSAYVICSRAIPAIEDLSLIHI